MPPLMTTFSGSSGPGAFRPDTVGTLRGWYDFSDLTTLFQDVAATTPVTTAGQTILRINNKVSGGPYLSHATLGPVYASVGGLMGGTFDGTKLLQASSTTYWKFLHTTAGHTIFFTVFMTDANPETRQMVLDNHNDTQTVAGVMALYRDAGADENLIEYAVRRAVSLTNTFDVFTANNTFPVQAWTQFTGRYEYGASGDDATARFDGVAVASQDTVNEPSAANPAYPLTVGRNANSAGQFLRGTIREILIYEGALSAANVAAVEEYLAA